MVTRSCGLLCLTLSPDPPESLKKRYVMNHLLETRTWLSSEVSVIWQFSLKLLTVHTCGALMAPGAGGGGNQSIQHVSIDRKSQPHALLLAP